MYDAAKNTEVQVSKSIFPAEAWDLISKSGEKELVILDVSTPLEYRGLHLPGAINVSLFSRFFKARLDIMDKDKTYVVYCKVEGRSRIAQKSMKRLGFKKVYNVTGGTMLWEDEGLPFATGTEGVKKFAFCPVCISVMTFKKIKKTLQNTCSCVVQES